MGIQVITAPFSQLHFRSSVFTFPPQHVPRRYFPTSRRHRILGGFPGTHGTRVPSTPSRCGSLYTRVPSTPSRCGSLYTRTPSIPSRCGTRVSSIPSKSGARVSINNSKPMWQASNIDSQQLCYLRTLDHVRQKLTSTYNKEAGKWGLDNIKARTKRRLGGWRWTREKRALRHPRKIGAPGSNAKPGRARERRRFHCE